jgi:cell wall-associated NlpC family hydrolase
MLFALAMVAPYSNEYSSIYQRVENMKKFVPNREALKQDYIRKFIRTTNLKYISISQLSSGDILLMNILNRHSKVDHIGVYIDNGEFVHLQRDRRDGCVKIERIDDVRSKILGIVRALDYGIAIKRT